MSSNAIANVMQNAEGRMQKGLFGGAGRDARESSFLGALSAAERGAAKDAGGAVDPTKKTGGTPVLPLVSPEAREAAQKIVSQLFFLPIVESMRDFPFGKGVGYGGRTEDAFGQQLDVRIADVMAGSDRSGLVEKMARKFEQRR